MNQLAEWKYYLRFTLERPRLWRTAGQGMIRYIATMAAQKMLGAAYPYLRRQLHRTQGPANRLRHYPALILAQAQTMVLPASLPADWLEHLPTTGWQPGQGLGLEKWSIPLATHSLAWNQLNWRYQTADQEDLFALHRFIWLLRWLSLRPQAKELPSADDIILNWLQQVTPIDQPAAWETYSVSERVVNWLLYLCATQATYPRSAPFAQTVGTALLRHLEYITYHLEYRYEQCNNHILNNARALYLGGRLLQLPQVAALGQALFQRHLPELIDSQGVLLEDSSHYQLLLTRTLVEAGWAAHITADAPFTAIIKPIAQAMGQVCRYLGQNSMPDHPDCFPRMGDVSPDTPISWFYPEPPGESSGESWWGLWQSAQIAPICQPITAAPATQEWQWFYHPKNTFKVLVHPPHYLKTYPRSHGHLDFGHFVLYGVNGPLLVDRGRFSYNADTLSRYGESAQAHNTSLINNLPLFPSCRPPFIGYQEYLQKHITFSFYQEKEQLVWSTRAVNRIDKALRWQRYLTFTETGLEIVETVANPSKARLNLTTYWHWAPGWTIQGDPMALNYTHCCLIAGTAPNYQFEVDCAGVKSQMEWFHGSATTPHGWYFPEYGQRVPALTLRLSLETTTNITITFRLCQR